MGIAVLFIVTAIPVVGFAESSTSSSSPKTEVKSIRGAIKNIKVQTKNSVKDIRTQAKESIKQNKEELNGKVNDIIASSTLSADEKKNKIEEERNKRIQEIRTNAQKNILKVREALKANLKKIKDQRKVQIVENTDQKLEKINNNRTDHLLNVLNNLEEVLAKINIRISAAQDKGVDVSSAKNSSSDASKAIADARVAVEAQAAKVYKMTITTENKLKVDVGNTVNKLQNDLKQVRAIVQNAHDSVRKTAVALAKALGFNDENSISSSVSSSVSSISSVSSVNASSSVSSVSSSESSSSVTSSSSSSTSSQ